MKTRRQLLIAFAAACAVAGAARSQQPRLVCRAPEFDFGRVDNKNVVEHTFQLQNEGDAELQIKAIRPDCGCTAVRADELAAPPGGSMKVHARLSLNGLRGLARKRIFIESNDPANPIFALVMRGEAMPGVEIRPERIALGAITLDSNDVIGVDIMFRTDRPVHILHMDVTSPFFAAREAAPLPGFQHRVMLHAVPPFAPGLIQAALVVLTDHPDFPSLEIPIIGRAVADLYVAPEEIQFDPDVGSRELARLVVVRSINGKTFEITNVHLPENGVRARKQSMRAGVYRIDLRFQPDPNLDGRVIKIETDYPGFHVLEVPFKAVHPEKREQESDLDKPTMEESP